MNSDTNALRPLLPPPPLLVVALVVLVLVLVELLFWPSLLPLPLPLPLPLLLLVAAATLVPFKRGPELPMLAFVNTSGGGTGYIGTKGTRLCTSAAARATHHAQQRKAAKPTSPRPRPSFPSLRGEDRG